MTKEELAAVLNGRQYREVPNLKDTQLAKENNLLIVYGASDDLCEFAGAIDDEFDCYDGGEIECEDLPSTIEAIWGEEDGKPSWSYKTDMPHAEFDIYEDDELYCIGMVIDLNEVNSTPMTAKQAYEIAQKNIVETSLKDAKNKESELWRWICTSIEKSAKNGSFKIIVENILPTDIAKKLENIGYEVKQAPRYDEPYTQISWIKT